MSVTYTINSEGIEVTYQVYQNQGPPGEGVPLGGTTGQVLAKVSGTDYDTDWIDNTGGGGGIPDAPSDGQAYVRQSAAWVIGLTLTEGNAAYDLKGSAFNVQGNLNDHEANMANPHGVTAAQTGAAPQDQFDDLDSQFQSHANDFENPHQVTAEQVGAAPLVNTDFFADFVDGDFATGTEAVADFAAWLEALNGTFTRGGVDHRYIDSDGYLVNGTADTLRPEHNSVSRSFRGTLIEPESQNLIKYSGNTAHGTWGFVLDNITKTPNNATGITGQTTATTVVETTAADGHHRMWYYNGSVLVTTGVPYAYSIYVKAIGERGLRVIPTGATGLGSTDVDFAAKSATNGWHLEEMRDGWFRLWKTAVATSDAIGGNVQFVVLKGGDDIYTGNASSGFEFEKAQYEEVESMDSPPTSYIDNPGADQNIRPADALAFDAPAGDLFSVYGEGSHAFATLTAGAYSLPPSTTQRTLRRLTTTITDETEVGGKVVDIQLSQDDVAGLGKTESPVFAGASVTGGWVNLDAEGDAFLANVGVSFQWTSNGSRSIIGNRAILIGSKAAEVATTFTNSICIGNEAVKLADSVQNSTIFNDTAASVAAYVSGSDIMGNECGNRHDSISASVLVGNFAGAGYGSGSTAASCVVIGQQATRNKSILSTVAIGQGAGHGVSGGSLTDCVIIGREAGGNVGSGDLTNLILIGRSAEAPTDATSDYLNLADLLTADLTTNAAQFAGGLGSYGTTPPTTQPSAIADVPTAGSATAAANATAINAILAAMRSSGEIAP